MPFALPLVLCFAPSAHAGDTWKNIRSGVDYLHRTTSGPQDIYAVRVDLTVPNVGLHASADADGTERHTNTSTFADSADVLVAINGDWSDGRTPVGMAISDGSQWHSHITDDTLGGRWGFFACTATKSCTVSAELPLDTAWWFSSPTIAPYRYFQAVGANGEILVSNGAAESGCYDSARNPRSAICLEADGTTLWLLAIDGRTSSAAGMTCDETRDLLLELGCWSGAMLDGGGSTTLVIEGEVKNNPSDGSLRAVANHLGIVYSDTLDARCAVSSGRWCEGTVLGTCQGGRYLGAGDCAAYGAGCEEDGDYAYCVDPRCPDGSGSGARCLDGSSIASCNDGQYSEGDCGVFGLSCGTDAGGSACMDPRCVAGPNSGFCTESGLYAACAAGVYSEGDCAAYGLECWQGAGTAACADARCPNGPDSQACTAEGALDSCVGGVYASRDCAAEGLVCDEAGGCVEEGEGGSLPPGLEDSASEPPGKVTPLDSLRGCGAELGLAALVLPLGTALRARRRQKVPATASPPGVGNKRADTRASAAAESRPSSTPPAT